MYLERGGAITSLEWVPQYAAAVCLMSACVAIMSAFLVYVELSAANISSEQNDADIINWMELFYWILIAQIILVFVAVNAFWVSTYYVGIVKYQARSQAKKKGPLYRPCRSNCSPSSPSLLRPARACKAAAS